MATSNKSLPEMVREAIDRGAKTAEEVHKAILHAPLDALEQVECLKEPMRQIKRVEDASIGAIYDLVHKINREVTKLADDMLPPPSPAKAKAKAAPKARRPARAAR
jgi:hypothetical protein